MKIPPTGTNRHKILVALYKGGPMRPSELELRLPNMKRIGDVLLQCKRLDLLNSANSIYDLADAVRKYFDDCEVDLSDFVPQIAGPIQGYANQPPMRGYEANLRRHWRAA
jgi:hypothetical protein